MKATALWIITIIIIGTFSFQNVSGHYPDFSVQTSEDILEFCEFFYDEYKLLGANSLADQHPTLPNLRACVILYNHIAWNSEHEGRDIVLIAEIEKYLGDSSYIKERHLGYENIIPEWVKREAQLWINNENQDIGFAYGIRTLLETGVLTLNFPDRVCNENYLCFKEGDFIKYSHFDKYGNIMTINHNVEAIIDDEIIINVQKVSKDGIEKENIIIDKTGLIKSEECCKKYEYLIPTSVKLGDNISDNVKILSETVYTIDNHEKQSWLASDATGQNKKIIDKKTGLVFSYKFHETKVLTVGEETKITDTNFFDTKYNMGEHKVSIPKWWKNTTVWLLENKISEEEYLRAMENLISRSILRV